MAERWNLRIFDLIKASNPADVLRKYRFKTPQHLKSFKSYLEKKLLAREKLRPHKEDMKQLQTLLWQNDIQPLPPASKPTLLSTAESSQPIPASANTPPQFFDERSDDGNTPNDHINSNNEPHYSLPTVPIQINTELEEQSLDLAKDEQFRAWVLDKDITICPACLNLQKDHQGFVGGHNGKTCGRLNRKSTEHERKALDNLKRRIKRNNK